MKVQVRKVSENTVESSCLISPDLFDFLKLSTGIMYEIHLGQLSKTSYIKQSKSMDGSIYLTKDIFNELVPYENMKLNIWVNNRDVFLGPVVGIFETPSMVAAIAGGQASSYEIQHMKAAIDEGCLSYYFSPEYIDWEEEKIKGVTFFPKLNKWEYFWFPMPDVIYDEGIFLSEQLKPIGKKVRREFRNNPNVKFINSRNGIDKWELCERLSKYPAVKKYIPDTIVYTSADDIKTMLYKYGFIFIKSFFGSKGQEVLSLEKVNDIYKMNFYDYKENKLKQLSMTTTAKVEEFISEFFGENKVIIQQGIRLLEFQNRKMDMRVLLQKNGRGIWECMYNCSRIAKKDSTITNTSAGGDDVIYEDIYPVLKSTYGNVEVPDNNEIVEASIKISNYIDREFGFFGELGLDMAIDIFGSLWILEANAKPQKDLETEFVDINGRLFINTVIESREKLSRGSIHVEQNPDIILPQALATFKYAKFLVKCR